MAMKYRMQGDKISLSHLGITMEINQACNDIGINYIKIAILAFVKLKITYFFILEKKSFEMKPLQKHVILSSAI